MKTGNNTPSVLIVEDDKLLSLVENRLISGLGYEVAGTASSGDEAILFVKEHNPDIVVMDISLNGSLDGVEAVEKLREFTSIPVIYLSGNSDKYNYERAKKTEFTDYLVKPVTAEDLTQPLKKASEKMGQSLVNRAS